MTLAAGARVVLSRTFDGDEILPLLRQERPSAGVVGVRSPRTARACVPTSRSTLPRRGRRRRTARARVGDKAPEESVVLDRMPLNATGKLDRVTLKQWPTDGMPPVGRERARA